MQMETTIDKQNAPVLQSIQVSRHEADLLNAAAFVKFGELLDVQLESIAPDIVKDLVPLQVAFVNTVRDEGVTFLHSITVHNGVPTQIEISGTHLDFKYRKKIRFN